MRNLSSSDTFVSKHFTVPAAEMEHVLEQLPSRHRRNNGKYEVQICNFCDKGNKRKESNQWKLCINDDGSYHCFRCAQHGSWFNLKQKALGTQGGVYSPQREVRIEANEVRHQTEGAIPDQSIAFAYTKALFAQKCDASKKALDYLTTKRGLDISILQRYGVGCTTKSFQNNDDVWESHTCITFPWMDKEGEVGVAEGGILRIRLRW